VTMTFLAVAGGFGALARYELGGWIQGRVPRPHPWGTLVVNTVGCLLLGFVHTSGFGGPETNRVLVAGFLGGFTTYSTWMVETTNLGEQGGRGGLRAGALNLVSMLGGGLFGIAVGVSMAEWIT
jgi:fluoride exporter